MDLKISMPDFEHTPAIDDLIRKKAYRLKKLCADILKCHVVIKYVTKRHLQGNWFDIRLDITLPGKEIAVNREESQDFAVAVRDAFDAAGRQIEGHVRQKRGEVKTHEVPQYGVIKRLFSEEEYGYLKAMQTDSEYYFHSSNVANPDFNALKVGDRVKFLADMGTEGPHAKRVTLSKS